MFVAKSVSHSVGLSSGAEQTTEVAVGLDVADGEEQQTSDENHSLSNFFIVSAPA